MLSNVYGLQVKYTLF